MPLNYYNSWNRLSNAERLNRLLRYVRTGAVRMGPEQQLSLFLTLMECHAIGYLSKQRYIFGMIYSDVVEYSSAEVTRVYGLKLDKYGKYILTPYVRKISRFWSTTPPVPTDPAEYRKPWAELDVGVRLDRLHRFVELYPGLTSAERTGLLMTIMEAFYHGHLEMPEMIEYDANMGLITKIYGMTDHVRASGFRKFRIKQYVP